MTIPELVCIIRIHRGIGVHHAAALAKGEPFRVNILCRRTTGHEHRSGNAIA